jgi:FtsH-binding integral membrane protein
MPHRIITIINWTYAHYWNFVSGVFFAFLSYFAEMQGAFHVMFAAFILDLFVGIGASKKIRKEKFSMEKFFTALLRMVIAYALVMLLYAMDKEMHQETLSLANISSWLVSGFLAFSIADNGFKVTGGRLFLSVKTMIRKKVQENTGIEIEEKDQIQ